MPSSYFKLIDCFRFIFRVFTYIFLASGFFGSMCLIVCILMHVWLMVASPLALLELGVQLRIY